MSFVNPDSLQHMSDVLGDRKGLAYSVLFAGALFETLIPLSLLIPGELFFFTGALMAGMGTLSVWNVLGLLYAGALLGDNASYWLGRRYGLAMFAGLRHWPLVGRLLRRSNFQRGMAFFERRGPAAVFIARLSGPLSWVTPTLAGVFRLNYPMFLLFNTLGIMIGIGQFIVVGYCFGQYLPEILLWAHRFAVTLFVGFILLASAGGWFWWRRREQSFP